MSDLKYFFNYINEKLPIRIFSFLEKKKEHFGGFRFIASNGEYLDFIICIISLYLAFTCESIKSNICRFGHVILACCCSCCYLTYRLYLYVNKIEGC